ncbi:hypothetical protein EVAR_22576_1 [Eumeta japonica]|uniref:Uncharacterized protein n=1 Tax=Eumeta variegata TaxID=151549 RepID=A0A4C1U870_EUMVA|nr:hypothetical protein EVAR_22576_1 [Eumeta japonica]
MHCCPGSAACAGRGPTDRFRANADRLSVRARFALDFGTGCLSSDDVTLERVPRAAGGPRYSPRPSHIRPGLMLHNRPYVRSMRFKLHANRQIKPCTVRNVRSAAATDGTGRRERRRDVVNNN